MLTWKDLLINIIVFPVFHTTFVGSKMIHRM